MRRRVVLRMYGEESDKAPLAWDWVEAQLAAAGTYWVVARTAGHPHPRPVWGVWRDERLHLSVGTPRTVRALQSDPAITVHLDSGTDVVIVEGRAAEGVADRDVVAAYDAKYDWTYEVAEFGPLTVVEPTTVVAWRAAGWAGRESFKQTGKWLFDS